MLPLRTDEDVVRARHHVRGLAQQAGLRLIDQTKLVTAVSELARNTVVHGGGGQMSAGLAQEGGRTGVWASFEDDGPGIPDIELAMRGGYTTGDGLGLGLGGARRLVHDFDVRSAVGEGTTIRVTSWR
ncbi:MAG: serine/threonine-protein kinase RsbT [Baekduia sp.]|jgi:serine/threonine-protein kinase RsbT|nr:serine/threonine-protein kinase RsbT [Baekduia sp.]